MKKIKKKEKILESLNESLKILKQQKEKIEPIINSKYIQENNPNILKSYLCDVQHIDESINEIEKFVNYVKEI